MRRSGTVNFPDEEVKLQSGVLGQEVHRSGTVDFPDEEVKL